VLLTFKCATGFTESEMEIVWDELVFNNHLVRDQAS
jgi:hypothetical protein